MKDSLSKLTTDIDVTKMRHDCLTETVTAHIAREEDVFKSIHEINDVVRGLKNSLHIFTKFLAFMTMLGGVIASTWDYIKNHMLS
jgi:hypothetical protein